MVTMQKRGEPSVQTFTLPLAPVVLQSDKDPEDVAKVSLLSCANKKSYKIPKGIQTREIVFCTIQSHRPG